MTHHLLQQTVLMKIAVSNRMSMDQGRFKLYFNRNERKEQAFKVEDYVFVDLQPQTVIASDAGNEMANWWHNKLLQRISAP